MHPHHSNAGKAFKQMLEAVSYKKELIISVFDESDGLLWNDQVGAGVSMQGCHMHSSLVASINTLSAWPAADAGLVGSPSTP